MSLQMVEGTYGICKMQIFQTSELADDKHLMREIVLVLGTNEIFTTAECGRK